MYLRCFPFPFLLSFLHFFLQDFTNPEHQEGGLGYRQVLLGCRVRWIIGCCRRRCRRCRVCFCLTHFCGLFMKKNNSRRVSEPQEINVALLKVKALELVRFCPYLWLRDVKGKSEIAAASFCRQFIKSFFENVISILLKSEGLGSTITASTVCCFTDCEWWLRMARTRDIFINVKCQTPLHTILSMLPLPHMYVTCVVAGL